MVRPGDLPKCDGKTGWPWTALDASVGDCTLGTEWPKISIVTPSYNQGRFIEETIRSILLQGYPNLEYFIVDGGSTDETVEVIRRYEPWLAGWVSEPDRGQSHAINKGFEWCTGDIITFCNSDDMYLPGTFGVLASSWKDWRNHGAHIGAFRFMDEESELGSRVFRPELPHKGPLDLSLGIPYRLHQAATFFNREALDAVGRHVCEELRYTLDRELLYRLCRSFPVYLNDRPFGAFRLHGESKSVSVLPAFYREFADLPLRWLSGDSREDRLRRRASRAYRAGGYMKYARSAPAWLPALGALLKAPWFRPSIVWQWSYVEAWLRLLGLRRKKPVIMPTGESGN